MGRNSPGKRIPVTTYRVTFCEGLVHGGMWILQPLSWSEFLYIYICVCIYMVYTYMHMCIYMVIYVLIFIYKIFYIFYILCNNIVCNTELYTTLFIFYIVCNILYNMKAAYLHMWTYTHVRLSSYGHAGMERLFAGPDDPERVPSGSCEPWACSTISTVSALPPATFGKRNRENGWLALFRVRNC